jgi:Imm-5 like putative immunity protein
MRRQILNNQSVMIPLSLDELRVIGQWAADCAERVLPLFEVKALGDTCPREAIEGIRDFARGGKRTAKLRSLALAALASAREVNDPAATAAARAAGLAASSAYTHPLATLDNAKHILGPAVYAALAREIAAEGDPAAGDTEVRWAVGHAPLEVREVMRRMPPRTPGRSRLDTLYYQLDSSLRR